MSSRACGVDAPAACGEGEAFLLGEIWGGKFLPEVSRGRSSRGDVAAAKG